LSSAVAVSFGEAAQACGYEGWRILPLNMGSAKILVGLGGSPRAEQRLDWVPIACKVNGLGVRFVLMRSSRSLDPEHRAHNRNCVLDPAANEGRFGVLVG
jgi:hypothetical protein